MKCELCGHEHNGTRMRTDTRYTRISRMLDECPHDRRGLIELCHICQRHISFKGGYIKYLADVTYEMAKLEKYRQLNRNRKRAVAANGNETSTP